MSAVQTPGLPGWPELVITERAVAKHTASIFLELGLQPSDDDNRRVLAVLAYLEG
jgi:hypothetical protein